MKRIPNARDVDKALRSSTMAIKNVLKGLNALAGQVMAKGNYEEAQALAEKGRQIRAFQEELASLGMKWRELRSIDAGVNNGAECTPLWGFYQPILKALLEVNGEGTREQIEPNVARLMTSEFLPGDKAVMTRGRERWREMIKRSRKHLAAEGWIEDDRSPIWKITAAGRKAANATSRGRE